MFNRVAHIATLLVAGIAAGITIGAVFLADLPVWIGLSTLVAVVVVTICSELDRSTSIDPRD